MLEWRNWQTHGTQNPATFTGHVGSTPTSSTILGTCIAERRHHRPGAVFSIALAVVLKPACLLTPRQRLPPFNFSHRFCQPTDAVLIHVDRIHANNCKARHSIAALLLSQVLLRALVV